MKVLLKRAVTLVAAAALLIGLLASGSVSAAGASDMFDGSSQKSSETLGLNQQMQLQFKVTSPFSSIGVYIYSNSNNKEIVLSLYKWNGNVVKSAESEPLASSSFTQWTRGGTVKLDFSSPVPAGEYMLELYVVSGEGVKLYWYSGAVKGVRGYRDSYEIEGAPMAEILFADGGSSASFAECSKPTKVEPKQAPPEYVIPEDHPISTLNVDSTQWTFVDGLGRPAVEQLEAGAKKDRKVGIFYWTWHYNFSGNKPVNVTKILEEYPDAKTDYNHKIWKSNNVGAYFWDEPLFGYYAIDEYVLRKHAELLADAGVDFVLFDCTNQDLTWEKCYTKLLEVWSEARNDGVKTPQIAFMMPFWDQKNTNSELKQVYKRIYKTGEYQDLWFYLDGKPFVMAIEESLDANDAYENEIRNFFTFRRGEPDYFKADHDDSWFGWLHVYPQALYKRADGSVESTTVGVAQNADYVRMCLSAMNGPHNMGRGFSMQKDYSYTYSYKGQQIVCSSSMENAYFYGINFQEQWDYALSVDPDIVFVTGWNEWIAGRNEEWGGVKNGFPDQCDAENSRDCEPSKGVLKDYYYYQLVNNVRKYKGMNAVPTQSVAKTVDLTDFSVWNDPNIVSYNHYAHNTKVRDNTKGWATVKFDNPGIRNDFITAKALNDDDYVYFYVKTENDITPYTDENWMRLIIDTGAGTAGSKDWEDFEFIIGRETGTADTLALERSTGGWNWEKVADVKYAVKGNEMQLAVKKSDLGISGNDFTLAFKWADANLADGDILTLYTDGDAAPGGRFAFVFNGSEAVVETAPPQETPEVSSGKNGCRSAVGASLGLLTVLAFACASLRKKER